MFDPFEVYDSEFEKAKEHRRRKRKKSDDVKDSLIESRVKLYLTAVEESTERALRRIKNAIRKESEAFRLAFFKDDNYCLFLKAIRESDMTSVRFLVSLLEKPLQVKILQLACARVKTQLQEVRNEYIASKYREENSSNSVKEILIVSNHTRLADSRAYEYESFKNKYLSKNDLNQLFKCLAKITIQYIELMDLDSYDSVTVRYERRPDEFWISEIDSVIYESEKRQKQKEVMGVYIHWISP